MRNTGNIIHIAPPREKTILANATPIK